MIRNIHIFFFLFTVFSHQCLPAQTPRYRFVNFRTEENRLMIDFEVNKVLDQDVITGMKKGMTAALLYEVQLWEKRPRWINSLITEKAIRMKINYDNWEQRFRLMRRDKTDSYDELLLQKECASLKNIPVADAGHLEENKIYYITVRIIVQPMTLENLEEMRDWLSGEVREIDPGDIEPVRSPAKQTTRWIFRLFRNVTGFSDRVVTARSPVFVWTGAHAVFEETPDAG